MKAKLRRITVDGEPYLWRFGYAPKAVWRTHEDVLVVFLPDTKSVSLRVFFKTWWYGPIGTPLHYEPRNMNSPRMVAQVIRYIRQHGWNPQENRGEHIIEDGAAILTSLGYNLNPESWWQDMRQASDSLQSGSEE